MQIDALAAPGGGFEAQWEIYYGENAYSMMAIGIDEEEFQQCAFEETLRFFKEYPECEEPELLCI